MTKRNFGWLEWLLVVLITILVIDQTRVLHVYPVPDTGMWFGDETWTMLTVRALASSGVARVPEAIGSSLAHSNGLINGSIWISGILFGAPALWFSNIASPVEIGRTITLAIAVLLLLAAYRLGRRLDFEPATTLISLLALVSSDAFFFSSHSARLDTITGFAVILCLLVMVRQFAAKDHSPTSLFLLTFCAVGSLAIYVHVPTLIALPVLYSLSVFGAFSNWRKLLASLSGGIAAVALLVIGYWLSTGSLRLLGEGYNQYYNVANSLPILHPFSWQVQKINTIDRAIQVWQVASPIVILIVLGAIVRLFTRSRFTSLERFALINALLIILSWMMFEGPAVYYNIHVLAVLALIGAILIAPAFRTLPKPAIQAALAITLTAFVIIALISQDNRASVGQRLVTENDHAIHALIYPIRSTTNPPLVLTDEPAENLLAGMSGVRLMTNHLLLFGAENRPLPDILKEHGVGYLLLYSTVRWHSPFRQIADSLYELKAQEIGTLTDQARTYTTPDWGNKDTLRLYKAK